jgi:Flp pilus assembly protein TadD
MRQNRLDDAREEFVKLAKLRSDAVGPKTMIGMIYDLQNRAQDATKVYEEIVSATDRAPVAANNLAWHYAERGEKLDVALQLAQSAKQQIPDSHEIDDTLGWVYYKRGMAEMAIAPLERSVKAMPGSALYHYHLGLAYAKTGRAADARRALERALQLESDFDGADEARTTLASLKG